MTKAVTDLTPSDPVLELGLQIGALIRRHRALEQLRPDSDTQRDAIQRAEKAGYLEQVAAENYALSMPCHSLSGACVHLLLAAGRVSGVAEDIGKGRKTDDLDAAAQAIRAALKVISKAAGMDLDLVGGDYYAPEWTDPFPSVSAAQAVGAATIGQG